MKGDNVTINVNHEEQSEGTRYMVTTIESKNIDVGSNVGSNYKETENFINCIAFGSSNRLEYKNRPKSTKQHQIDRKKWKSRRKAKRGDFSIKVTPELILL